MNNNTTPLQVIGWLVTISMIAYLVITLAAFTAIEIQINRIEARIERAF